MGGHLAGGCKGETTARADAVEVVGGLAVHAAFVLALLILVELLEAILGIGIVFNVVALVLLDVTLVFKCECAARTSGNLKKKSMSPLFTKTPHCKAAVGGVGRRGEERGGGSCKRFT